VAGGVDELVDSSPDPLDRVHAFALLDGLIRTGFVNLVGSLAIQPVVGAAEAEALGRDDANVVRRERLAEQAGVERVDGLVGHGLQPTVALVVDLARHGHALHDFLGVGDQRDFDLVHDGGILGEQLGVQDVAVVAQPQPLGKAGLGDARPDDVALPHVPDALGAVDEVMDLALEDRLEVGLHFASRDLDPDGEGEGGTGGNLVNVRSDDLDVAVVDLVQTDGRDKLEGRGAVAAELDLHVRLADALALERRAVGHGDRDLGDLDLAAAYFERALDHGGVWHVRDHVLVGADAGGQNLRNVRVRDHREAVVDGARGGSIFLRRDFAQREHEGEDAVLVVLQVPLEVARLDAAERKRGAVGESQRVDRGGDIAPERHEARLPAELHAGLGQLFGELHAVGATGHEDIKVFLLQFAGDLDGDLLGGRRADDGREAWRRAIHKFDAAFAHDHVVGGAKPDAVHRVRADHVLAGLDDFAGEERCGTGVQRVAEVGKPDLVRRPLREQLLGAAQDGAHVAQRGNLFAGERIDHRQKVGGVGKCDRTRLALGCDRLCELRLGPGNPFDGAVDGAAADQFRHWCLSDPSYPGVCARPCG